MVKNSRLKCWWEVDELGETRNKCLDDMNASWNILLKWYRPLQSFLEKMNWLNVTHIMALWFSITLVSIKYFIYSEILMRYVPCWWKREIIAANIRACFSGVCLRYSYSLSWVSSSYIFWEKKEHPVLFKLFPINSVSMWRFSAYFIICIWFGENNINYKCEDRTGCGCPTI